MPTPKKGPRFGGSPAHQKAILANLATSLFEHGSITTTEAKARLLRPYAERLITKARRGDLHNRRQVMSVIRDKTVVHMLFTEIGPRFSERPGGYTRITKIGPRKGDNAPMAVISLVDAEFTPRVRSTGAAPATASARPETGSTASAAPATAAVDGESSSAEQEAPPAPPADEADDATDSPLQTPVDDQDDAVAASADDQDDAVAAPADDQNDGAAAPSEEPFDADPAAQADTPSGQAADDVALPDSAEDDDATPAEAPDDESK